MSGRQDWETPWELFDKLDAHYQFTVDAAASPENTKCDAYITQENDAHTIDLTGQVIWCNPTYDNLTPWVADFRRWQLSGNLGVYLTQDKTDTEWFAELWTYASMVTFLSPGRVNFVDTITGNMHGAVVWELPADRPVGVPNYVRLWDWRKTGWTGGALVKN